MARVMRTLVAVGAVMVLATPCVAGTTHEAPLAVRKPGPVIRA